MSWEIQKQVGGLTNAPLATLILVTMLGAISSMSKKTRDRLIKFTGSRGHEHRSDKHLGSKRNPFWFIEGPTNQLPDSLRAYWYVFQENLIHPFVSLT